MATAGCSSSQPTPKPRKFTKIPVFIVENHNDVLELILPALARRYLPFEGNLMVHFDSHPDCCLPRLMPAETVFDRKTLLESLSIENWIMPMMFSGNLAECIWIRPEWAKQIPDGRHKFKIGKNDEKIKVDSTLDYFLSDGGYSEGKFLENCKEICLHVSEVNESVVEAIGDRDFILDIDLDYFSTLNPFLEIYPKAKTYEKLRKIFKVEKSYDKDDPASVAEYVKERNRQLDFFETIFQHMAQNGSLEKFKFEDPTLKHKFELVKDLIDCLCHNYSIYDIDWFIVNDAGCTTDEPVDLELPNHESTEEKIKEMILKFEKFLKSLKKFPTIITIARSTTDGYTPGYQIESIQSQVLEVLRKVYAEYLGEETLWYKNKGDISVLELVDPRKK